MTPVYSTEPERKCASGGPQIGGFTGWWTWLFINIAFLADCRNRLGALLTIGWQAR